VDNGTGCGEIRRPSRNSLGLGDVELPQLDGDDLLA
jgi:hypothetical protein